MESFRQLMLGRSESPSFSEREGLPEGYPPLFIFCMFCTDGQHYFLVLHFSLSLLASCEHAEVVYVTRTTKSNSLTFSGSLLSLPACAFLCQIGLGQSWPSWSHEGLVYLVLTQLGSLHAPCVTLQEQEWVPWVLGTPGCCF